MKQKIRFLFWQLALIYWLTGSASAAILQATFNSVSPGTNIDLTTQGGFDWAHWGLVNTNSFDHKTAVTQQISNVSLVNTNTFQQYSDNAHGYSWNDGTPTAAATNSTTGISMTGLTNGFQITASAGLVAKELKLYVGANKARGTVLAMLNDASAPNFTGSSLDSTEVTNGVYLLRFAAGASNRTLTVRYSVAELYDSAGFITLQSASLSTNSANLPPSVAISTPTNNARFIAPTNISIAANASDVDGIISKVEFFQGGSKIGEATNSPYTLIWSNVLAGDYALTAMATDNSGATNVSSAINVSVVTNTWPTVSITGPTNNARFYSPANIPFTVDAFDIDGAVRKVEYYQGASKIGQSTNTPFSFTWSNVFGGNYSVTAIATDDRGATNISSAINVIIITNTPPTIAISSPDDEAEFVVPAAIPINTAPFDADGFVQKVEFFQGTTKLGQVTNAPFNFVWSGATPGIYTLTARATDDADAPVDSAPITVFVTTTGGALASAVNTPSNIVNLTSEGLADWTHWGLFTETTVNRKAGVTQQISDLTVTSADGFDYRFDDNSNGYLWSDGTPTAVMTNTTTGVFVTGFKNGFQLTSPADTMPRTLKVYVGAYAARGKFRSYLSDFTAPIYTDTSLNNLGNGPGAVYSLNYKAASAGKTLIVQFSVATMNALDGNVTLQAAALTTSNALPTVSLLAPTNNSAFFGPTNITLTANPSDSDGTIAKVEFYNGAVKLGQVTNEPFSFLWTNVALGSYSIAAKATDNLGATFTSTPINIFVGIGGGILNGQIATPPKTNNLTTEGAIDWVHWGLQTVSSVNRKIVVTPKIGNLTVYGSNGQKGQYDDSKTRIEWSDGSPTGAASSTTGIFVTGLTNGFQLTAPADQSRKRLRVYVGLYGAQGKFQAGLNDFSAPPYNDNSLLNAGDNATAVYTLDYCAASSNKTLTVQYTCAALYDATFGNVTIQAATFAPTPPPVPLLLNPLVTGNNFQLSFLAERGFSYFAEATDSFSPTNWQLLQSFFGDGATLSFTNAGALTFSNRFYRLRVQ